jgi:hypothetical protein
MRIQQLFLLRPSTILSCSIFPLLPYFSRGAAHALAYKSILCTKPTRFGCQPSSCIALLELPLRLVFIASAKRSSSTPAMFTLPWKPSCIGSSFYHNSHTFLTGDQIKHRVHTLPEIKGSLSTAACKALATSSTWIRPGILSGSALTETVLTPAFAASNCGKNSPVQMDPAPP